MSRLQLVAKLSLEGVSEGWTKDHFLTFKVVDSQGSRELTQKLSALDKDDNEGFLSLYVEFAKRQFQAGKVLVNGETVDAEADDIDDLPAILTTSAFELFTRSKFDDPKVGKS